MAWTPGNKEIKMAAKLLPQDGSFCRWLCGPGDKGKMVDKPPPPSHVVEGENQVKNEQHSNQTSAITKLPLPPNSKQQGTRTKAKETWSPKPVKRYQDICSIPPNRASPSGASSEPAVSISLSLFGPLDPVGVALQFWVITTLCGEVGRRSSTGHQNQQPWHRRSQLAPAEKYLWTLPWNSLGLRNAVSWRPAPGREFREKQKASALCCFCLEKQLS